MIEVVSLHRLIIDEMGTRADPIGTVHPVLPNGALARALQHFAENVRDRSELVGRAQSAWWPSGPPAEVDDLRSCDANDFEAASDGAMARLVKLASQVRAKSGLVLFSRLVANGSDALLCLKLDLRDEELTRFNEDAKGEEAIVAEIIANVLPGPGKLQKAVLLPHPDGGADARVVDDQTHAGANYWLESLGLRAGPKETKVARALVEGVASALEALNVEEARRIVDQELAAVSSGDKTLPVKEFCTQVATAADIPAEPLLDAVRAQDAMLCDPRARLTPRAARQIDTLIELADDVKLRGPATALAGRYAITRGDEHEGWRLTVQSQRQPRVTHPPHHG